MAIFVTLLIVFASSIIAGGSLSEQRRTREAGTDPVVNAHFGQREDDPRELVTFNLTNVGAGAAMNVQIQVEQPEADGVDRNLITNIFARHHPFRVIPQNESASLSVALGWDLLGEKPLPPFTVELTYEDLDGAEYDNTFRLDVREMEKLGAKKSSLMRITSALEKIAKHGG